MSMRETSSRTREWMKEHEEEVEQVRQRCDALKLLSLGELAEMADDEGADLTKVKELLVAKIIAAESAR